MDTPSPQQDLQISTENKSSVGGVVGTIIILAIIILGALYFWGKRIEESRLNPPSSPENQANVVETLPPIQVHITATSTATTTLNKK